MKRICALLVMLASLLLTACSVHPLPENFEARGTVQIVERIRCEARRSIQDVAIGLLRKHGNAKDLDLADRLDRERNLFKSITAAMLPTQDETDFYNKYVDTGIAFNFTFDISEENDNSTEIDFAKMITNGTVSLKAVGRSDLIRNSNRQFIVSDKFSELLTDPKMKCQEEQDAPNLIYPVTGSIGLHELIQTFIDLNEADELGTLENKSSVLADQLIFTTTFSGTVNPMIMLNTPGSRFRLSQAMVNSINTRTDKNTVIVGLSMSPRKGEATRSTVTALPLGGIGPARTAFAKRNASPAETRAIDATVQKRIDTFYDRFGSLLLR